MIREVQPGEEPELAAFLRRHLDTSMFLLGNLLSHGLRGDHAHATTFYRMPEHGAIRAVFGVNRRGGVLYQAPGMHRSDARAFANVMAGRRVSGVIGHAEQGRQLLQVLGLTPAIDLVEPLYRLELSQMVTPDAPCTTIRRPGPGDQAMLETWFETYVTETKLMPQGAAARSDAQKRALAAVNGGPQRLLLRDGTPVAMAALNATAEDHVQVGGVFVPPKHRDQGLGRAVTYAVLDEARTKGAKVAILFANSTAAARAYEALGFAQIGEIRIALTNPEEDPE